MPTSTDATDPGCMFETRTPTIQSFPRQPPPETSQWRIEPLRHGDVAAVTELFEAMSASSRRRRFLSPMPRLTAKMLTRLTDVDGVRHIAVAARVRGRCVGIARAVVVRDDPSVADVAVAVADAHQGRGLGRTLVDALAHEARAIGIRRLDAMVDPANSAALGLVRSVTSKASYDEGLIHAEWSLPYAKSA
jgi:L-amino acid N-acyltransferase YncA